MAKKTQESLGRIVFYVGLVISILAGFTKVGELGNIVLLVLGVVTGLLNITGKETQRFLLATLVLFATGLGLMQVLGPSVSSIIDTFVSFTAAAAFVVALKEIYTIEKGR